MLTQGDAVCFNTDEEESAMPHLQDAAG